VISSPQKVDVKQAMTEVARKAAEPLLMAYMIKLTDIFLKAIDFLVDQFKEWKKSHRDPKYSTTFDEILVRLQNQVSQDTALSKVKDFARAYIDKSLLRLQPFHLSVEEEKVTEMLNHALCTRFALRGFSKEVMALTIDVMELDLLRIHFVVLDGMI